MNFIRKIEGKLAFEKKFTFCTLVTRFDEYMEMVESAKKAGFDGNDVEFLYFDNKNSNQFDGYSGINRAIKEAKGEYLIFCHQDILFHADKRHDLELKLKELSGIDENWAIAGNAGKGYLTNVSIRITDPHHENLKEGEFPSLVMSLDENFLIINQRVNIANTDNMKGFHLYAIDLCQNAKSLGYSSYVIDFHLYHKSPGKVDQSYFDVQSAFMTMQSKRKQDQFFWAMCSNFYVSNSKFKMWLFNLKRVLRFCRMLHKQQFKKNRK